MLSHNCIGDQGIEALARAMCYEQPGGHSALQHLIELKLERNLIGDRGAAALAMALRARAVRSLVELHLDHNLIGDKGLGACPRGGVALAGSDGDHGLRVGTIR